MFSLGGPHHFSLPLPRALNVNPIDQKPADPDARRAEMENIFLSSLPDIERVTRFIARRHRLSQAESEDFSGEVNLAIIRGNYAVLAAFEGRSSLRTYLTTVIQRMFLDYRRRLWGKWRPSAEAKRRGPVALRLEMLLYREGLGFDEAVETLRTNLGFGESREALAELAHLIPKRTDRRAVAEGVEDIGTVPADPITGPEALFEGAHTSARAQSLISSVIEGLAPQDRIVLRLRFEDDVSVADIARRLNLDQKKLYRHIEELLTKFRKLLSEQGLGWPEVIRMIERGQCHLRLPPLDPEKPGPRPSPSEVQA